MNIGGFKIWECSLDLVAYLNEIVSKGYVIPSHVMELGCGHGLPGIYALKNGAERVTFTDYNREVLSLITIPNLVKNMRLPIEQLRDRVSLYAGSWESVTKYIRDNEQQCRTRYQADLILSAETLYTENVTSDLYQMIKRHLQVSNPKAIALVASKRYYFGTGGSVKHFLDLVNNDNANLEAKVVWCADNHRSNIREIVRVKAK
ncbi:unnamed protein product [Albugo candida]|nr:unnamed protein product [Albugo candida]|eukprot:CCI40587.1 unnamed protein product [Albugo candida]